ncbi:MAG: transcription repressor NadR [Christensenellales bacterium]|jgi:transcriptional regulator of NAD metabolism
MKLEERRESILAVLAAERKPVTGTRLAERFGVSRQIIVRDIAALTGQGYDILSTRRGYLLRKSPFKSRVFKVHHAPEQSEEELTSIVDLGGTIVDVFVWHKVYGKITAPLYISSRLQVRQYMEGVRSGKSKELLNVTGGYHYHTVRAGSEEVLDLIEAALRRGDYIVPELDYSGEKPRNFPGNEE